jgi:hypothetical protein
MWVFDEPKGCLGGLTREGNKRERARERKMPLKEGSERGKQEEEARENENRVASGREEGGEERVIYLFSA